MAKSLNQPGRNRAAAGLDASGPIEQQHRAALPGECRGCRRARRSAADHHHIEDFRSALRHRHALPHRPAAGFSPIAASVRRGIEVLGRCRARSEADGREEQAGLDRKDRGIGGERIAGKGSAPDRPKPRRAKPPRPKAIACAAPHSPMRTPSRRSRPAPRERHHRADRGDRERAIGEAEQEDGGAQRPVRRGIVRPQRQRDPSAAADARASRHRPAAQRAEAAPADERGEIAPISSMPVEHAAMLDPGKLRRGAGREAEDAPANGSRIRSCAL